MSEEISSRRRVLAKGVAVGMAGIVAVTLPSAGASASAVGGGGGAYSSSSPPDANMYAVSAVPGVNADGSVTVTGTDTAP